MKRKPIWQIKLLVETDDPEELERLSDAVGRVAFPEDDHTPHACAIPWFVITSPAEDPEDLRDLLNR